MPYVVKATWIFGGVEHGWREQLYFEQSNDDLSIAIAQIDAIAELRKQMLGAQYFIKATSAKLVLNNAGNPYNGGSRVSRVRRVNSNTWPGAQVDLCVLLSFYPVGSRQKKSMFLGGIPDDLEVNGGQISGGPTGWTSAFNTWVTAIKNNLGISLPTPDGGPACVGWLHSIRQPLPYQVKSYVVSTSQFVTIETAQAVWTETPGTKLTVRLAGMAGLQKSVLNGLQAVQVIDTTKIMLLRQQSCAPSPGPIGTVSRYTYELLKAPTINPEEIRTHERGRPLLVSPGRRPNRPRT